MTTETISENETIVRRSLFHGLPIAFLVIVLLFYWFGLADRYIVFLYNHDMGPLYPDTSPFSAVTSSRYWMAGLVASGFVLVLYTTVNWLVGRIRPHYAPPSWKLVWLVCAPIFIVVVPLITTGIQEPALPWYLAASVTLAAIIGVALALPPGKLAARRPWDLLWLAADGWGLALILLMLSQLDDFGRWLSTGVDWRVMLGLGVLILGIFWLLFLTVVRYILGVTVGNFLSLAAAASCVIYLMLPLVHHLLGTDGYFYISDSDNFMAASLPLQVLAWLLLALVIWVLVSLRRQLAKTERGSKTKRSLAQ